MSDDGKPKLVQLPTPATRAAANVVEMLRDTLADAESGRIVACAVIIGTVEGGTGTGFVVNNRLPQLYLATGRLQLRLLEFEGDED